MIETVKAMWAELPLWGKLACMIGVVVVILAML